MSHISESFGWPKKRVEDYLIGVFLLWARIYDRNSWHISGDLLTEILETGEKEKFFENQLCVTFLSEFWCVFLLSEFATNGGIQSWDEILSNKPWHRPSKWFREEICCRSDHKFFITQKFWMWNMQHILPRESVAADCIIGLRRLHALQYTIQFAPRTYKKVFFVRSRKAFGGIWF